MMWLRRAGTTGSGTMAPMEGPAMSVAGLIDLVESVTAVARVKGNDAGAGTGAGSCAVGGDGRLIV